MHCSVMNRELMAYKYNTKSLPGVDGVQSRGKYTQFEIKVCSAVVIMIIAGSSNSRYLLVSIY